MNYHLLKDFVLVKRFNIPLTTKGGIFLPLKAVELPQLARIVKIGPLNPDQLQPGEIVIIKKHEGHRIFIDGDELHLLRVEDLLAAIKES